MGRESHRLRLFLAIEAPFFPEVKVFSAERAMTPLLRHGVKLFSLAIVALGAETILCARVDGDSRGSAYRVIPVLPWLPAISADRGHWHSIPLQQRVVQRKADDKACTLREGRPQFSPAKIATGKGRLDLSLQELQMRGIAAPSPPASSVSSTDRLVSMAT